MIAAIRRYFRARRAEHDIIDWLAGFKYAQQLTKRGEIAKLQLRMESEPFKPFERGMAAFVAQQQEGQ